MTTPFDQHLSHNLVPLSVAAREIGDDRYPCSPEVVRRNALKLQVLRRMPDGRLAIDRPTMEAFRRIYRACGYLTPRGARSLDMFAEVSASA
jgi:hypothetical protein